MGDKAINMSCDRTALVSLTAFLNALEVVGTSLHQILCTAEQEGMPAVELVDWTYKFLKRTANRDNRSEAELLVFSCIQNWKEVLPSIMKQGDPLLKAVLLGDPRRPESLCSLPDHHFVQHFRERVLRRMGYPKCLSRCSRTKVDTQKHLAEVMTWLESGRDLLGDELELSGFRTTARSWGALNAHRMVLLDGHGPDHLEWCSHAYGLARAPWGLRHTFRMEGVSGVRSLAVIPYGQVSLCACPDLESLTSPCNELEIDSCPRLSRIPVGSSTNRLVLKHCPELRSIDFQVDDHAPDVPAKALGSSPLGEVAILDCGNLRTLPPRLAVRGNVHLRGVGPLESWPWDFQVGGTLLVEDCPQLEMLPPVAVQGSLVVVGGSGLRRLSPGTVVGKHLDLRVCTHLEDIPRGVKVGGTMFLPEHLNHRRKAYVSLPVDGPVLLEAPGPDLYEDLRDAIRPLRFLDLIPSRERLDARNRAAEILLALTARLEVEPGLESLLLWTASEVWRDLSEDEWAARNPLESDRNESDEDLPMAWLLSLLKK